MEEKNNSDVILISLPIKRNTIVLSKYVSVYVYAAFAMAGFYLVYLMVNLLNIPLRIHLRGQLFLVALIAVTFFSCICLPLTFKYGYTKAKMPNLVIFLLFVFGGTGIVNYLRSSNQTLLSQAVATFLSTRSCLEISLAVAGGLALVLVFSYFTSLFFYKKREW